MTRKQKQKQKQKQKSKTKTKHTKKFKMPFLLTFLNKVLHVHFVLFKITM